MSTRPVQVGGLERAESLERVDTPSEPGFGDALMEAVHKVDALQTEADTEATKAAHGAGNLHELSLALEKADVAMRVLVKVRNKAVDAYNEVMRMTI